MLPAGARTCQKCTRLKHLVRGVNPFRDVSTWSSLGAAFNSLPSKKINFSITNNGSGLFGINCLSSHEGFYILKEQACNKAEVLVKETCSSNRTRKMVDVFDELSDTLCQVADLAEFVRVAHPKAAYRSAAEDASVNISGVVESLNTNRPLYDNLKAVVQHGDNMATTPVDNHVASLFLFDFEQSGIHLPESERQRVVDLNEAILNLGQHFMAGASNNRVVSKDILPEPLRQYFAMDNDNIVVNGLYADSPNEQAREAAYRIYLHPDLHQDYLLDQLLQSRHELALICGFDTYSHRATRGTTAETPQFVGAFLKKLRDELKPKTEVDLQQMLKLKQLENPFAKKIQPWDVGYFTTRVRKNFMKLSSDDLSVYFCLGACMEGLNNLTQKLFGISLVCEEADPGEFWVSEIYKLAVTHESEGLLGHIFCDFYQRPGKPVQDCHFTIRGGRRLADGSYQNPVVVLMLNLQRPRWSSPCLLTPSQLDNLAHEMGHALHSMLARTTHQHVTGTRCCTDFAEVPSILMEYFVSDPRVLKTFAKHFQTQEPMSDEAIQRLCDSKHLMSASETLTQVMYSALDQSLHGSHPLQGTTTQLFQDIQREFSVLEPVDDTAWQLRFSHLVGYGAKYYSYLLSRSIASWIWQTYFKENPFSRDQGERYRQECLSHGGGKPPRTLLTEFLNKETSPEAMAESLTLDIAQHQHIISKYAT